MSSYDTVPGTSSETIEISNIIWKDDTVKIFPKCLHKRKSCQSKSYTITGEATDDSTHIGWDTNGCEAPSYDIGPGGYYVPKDVIDNHPKELEPYIEEHCEVCNV